MFPLSYCWMMFSMLTMAVLYDLQQNKPLTKNVNLYCTKMLLEPRSKSWCVCSLMFVGFRKYCFWLRQRNYIELKTPNVVFKVMRNIVNLKTFLS